MVFNVYFSNEIYQTSGYINTPGKESFLAVFFQSLFLYAFVSRGPRATIYTLFCHYFAENEKSQDSNIALNFCFKFSKQSKLFSPFV